MMLLRKTLLVTALTLAISGAGAGVAGATPGPTPDQGLTGAYCIKKGTQFDPSNNCGNSCEPSKKNCGTAQGVPM